MPPPSLFPLDSLDFDNPEFDLDEIRKAGLLPADQAFVFKVDRAGINDDIFGQRASSIHTAVILSNQGARHFDTWPATLEMLPEVVDAIGDKAEVIFDSGIRRGTDILKAIALGATAVTGARLYCYGLAAGGQAGVERALSLLRDEVERDMIFLGAKTLADVNAASIRKNT